MIEFVMSVVQTEAEEVSKVTGTVSVMVERIVDTRVLTVEVVPCFLVSV